MTLCAVCSGPASFSAPLRVGVKCGDPPRRRIPPFAQTRSWSPVTRCARTGSYLIHVSVRQRKRHDKTRTGLFVPLWRGGGRLTCSGRRRLEPATSTLAMLPGQVLNLNDVTTWSVSRPFCVLMELRRCASVSPSLEGTSTGPKIRRHKEGLLRRLTQVSPRRIQSQ